MKKPIFIANWKMNLTPKKEAILAKEITKNIICLNGVEVVFCPSFAGLSLVQALIQKTGSSLGAQDVFWKKSGAYTGEISAEALAELDCHYVIVGHSERRQLFKETNEMVNKKIIICLENKLRPIICVGETRLERKDNQTDYVVSRQLEKSLTDINLIEGGEVIIAYEPVWAIGSGNVVEADDLNHIFHVIRQSLINFWPLHIVNNTRLIYGGSVDENNIVNFKDLELLNGFLIGTASLDAREFTSIIKKSI